MKILITTPVLSIHGGMRILFEWATRLKKLGHDIGLFVENGHTQCDWYDLSEIKITTDRNAYRSYNCIVIGSPHSIWIEDFIKPGQKCFLFMQMVEELFRPNDLNWLNACRQFYLSRFPIIHGSQWGEAHVRNMGRKGAMYYIGNGVNFDHFPISNKPKDGKTILIESPMPSNPAKDVDHLALKVAARLKKEGYRITGYGAQPLKQYAHVVDEYHYRPSLELMNRLYEDATILIKATKWDARALSPVEAMTKGTVTARAIIRGDDDLIDVGNCLISTYDEHILYHTAKDLLRNDLLRERIASNCLSYVQEHCRWGKIIDKLNTILCA